MVESNKINRKFDMVPSDEAEESTNYLDIWDVNPSYRDINLKMSLIKILFSIIFLLLAVSTYLLTFNLYFSLGLGIFTFLLFILAFSDNFYSFRDFWFKIFHRYIPITPFQKFAFWKLQDDPATIIIINKKDSLSIAIRIFKVETLPENVYPTLNQFLKALNKAKIPYTYQVVQNPIFDSSENLPEETFQLELIRNQKLNSIESFQTTIYFSVYHSINGILTNTRLKALTESVQDISNEFKSNFSANFHHTKVSLLTDNDLINAIRTSFWKSSMELARNEMDYFITKSNLLKVLFRTGIVSFLVVYLSLILIVVNLPVYLVIFIDLLVEIAVIYIWWRDILYFLSKKLVAQRTEITTVNPFIDVKFFQIKGLKNVLFAYIDNTLLLASKIFNLCSATQPALTYFDKFIRGIGNHKINFNYNLQVAPVSTDAFPRECSISFNEKTQEDLEGILFHPLDKPDVNYVKNPKLELEKWLDMRTGIWNTMLTISTSSYLYTSDLKFDDFIELDKKLTRTSKLLKRTFEDNFLNFKLVELKSQVLSSGFISECFKNHNFRLNGSHLNYVYFQGKNLIELAKIVNEFKKGIDTRIAAEFNTPLQLKNFITIGRTINTEFLEEEIPLGFTFEQLNQLLITNGIPSYREHAKMKIVSELVKSNIPCVIFDYTGNWSKLIQLFDNTIYQDRFLHFKLGSSFSVDIKNSGIKYDQHNLEYLNLLYDVFALAFKEQKRNIEILKETISKQDELDLTSITLDLQTKQKYEKSFYSNSLLLLFKDFTDQSQIFSNTALEYEDDINPIDFLRNDKTVIIDLSILKDLDKKTFLAFIILSKFIHFIENSDNYYKKIIVIPHTDLFFDSYYIDTNFGTANYGKIDKFIEPLLQRGFGLIFSANQIHYLHPHIFNYFQNIITFRANDTRDIAVLKNRMLLQELHGTGYYSSKRNNTYQIDYLMNMQDNETIVKRSDIYQPFPGKIQIGKLLKVMPLTHDQIMNYMEEKGYKLKLSERRLLNRAKKTIFEKDFGIYAAFIDEIIHFLKTISSIDNIGNLYKHKLKKELLQYIGPKAAKRVQDNSQIKEIRDELFDILIKQGYLIEHHPKRASGSESMRSSYAIGPQYQKAVQDYFESKGNLTTNINVDIIEKNTPSNSKILNLYQDNANNQVIDVKKFQKLLQTETIELNYNLFKMYCDMEDKDYLSSLEKGQNIIADFLTNLHTKNLQENKNLVSELNDFTSFLEYLTKNELLPFSAEDLRFYLRKVIELTSYNGNNEKRANELFDLISEFYKKLNI
jgi:hypothetical protein